MSEREDAQREIADFIIGNPFFNAPYGTTCGLQKLDRGGYVRTITFGRARTLDATVYIWRPDNISISAQGGLAPRVAGVFSSVGQVIQRLQDLADLLVPENVRYRY